MQWIQAGCEDEFRDFKIRWNGWSSLGERRTDHAERRADDHQRSAFDDHSGGQNHITSQSLRYVGLKPEVVIALTLYDIVRDVTDERIRSIAGHAVDGGQSNPHPSTVILTIAVINRDAR